MAFTDALDLRTAVVETVGNASIADVWPRLVKLAEAKLNQKLRTRFQVSGAAIVIPGPLPADYLEAISYSGDKRHHGHWSVTVGLPAGSYELTYYAKIPTIGDILTASNWLLEKYPDVYLYAASVEAAKHLRDMEAVPALGALLDGAMRDCHVDDERARFGAAVVRVAGPTP